jgi:carbamate kinase
MTRIVVALGGNALARRGDGSPNARRIRELDAAGARALVADGVAGAGSMAPKLEAAARFAEAGGVAIIGSLDAAADALDRLSGTRVSGV